MRGGASLEARSQAERGNEKKSSLLTPPPRLLEYIEIQSQQAGRNDPPTRAAAMHNALLPLEWLESGEWGEVADVTGEPAWVGRMAELGVRVGTRLRVLQQGQPCLL